MLRKNSGCKCKYVFQLCFVSHIFLVLLQYIQVNQYVLKSGFYITPFCVIAILVILNCSLLY